MPGEMHCEQKMQIRGVIPGAREPVLEKAGKTENGWSDTGRKFRNKSEIPRL
jgi:hypothetical protein